MESKIKGEIPEDHPIIAWLVKHAAANLNRFHIGADGMTAHRRLRGRNFKKEMVDFGETVWYLIPKSKGKNKLRSRWASGVWLGIREESGEAIIGLRGDQSENSQKEGIGGGEMGRRGN